MKVFKKIIAVSFLAISASSQAAVVASGNGDFESTNTSDMTYFGSTNGIYDGGLTTLEGWTFSGGTNNTFRWLFEDPNPYGPVIGEYALNLTQADSNFANVASTTVTGLVGGEDYTLVFDAAVRSGAATPGLITVLVDGASVGTFDSSIGTSYATQTFTFTPASSTAILSFNYANTVNTNGYMLDNVSVIPEPSSALLGGLGLLALMRRRR